MAPTGSRVLITGPAGSGKEVVARMIHARSRRADGPFVVMNCATLNPGSLRGGTVRAGGRRRSRSRSRAAPACWNAPMAARCCSTRSPTCRWRRRARSSARCRTRPSSGSAARSRVKVDVRVLSTTNRDLQAEIAAGPVPRGPVLSPGRGAAEGAALRERREDVPVLARHFIARSAETSGMPSRRVVGGRAGGAAGL